MKKYNNFLLVIIIISIAFYSFFLVSCKKNEKQSSNNEHFNDIIIYEQYFIKLEKLLKVDNGKFWGKEIYGPMLLVDPKTRIFYTNYNSKNESFKKIGEIFTDTLPQQINIANSSVHWEGITWAMIMLPIPENGIDRNKLMIHELIHVLQPKIGFEELLEYDTSHLDKKEFRILLKLELEALKSALSSSASDSIHRHLNNAMAFRNARQIDQNIRKAENSLELNEGIVEYSAISLSGMNNNEQKAYLINSIDLFYMDESYLRSFAYEAIPVYGYFLSIINSNWHRSINKETDLSKFFRENLNLQPSLNIKKIPGYKRESIEREEFERHTSIQKKISFYKDLFVNKPTLQLPLTEFNMSFDYQKILSLDGHGKVYPKIRFTANWGILDVEKGALINDNWSNVKVSEPTQEKDSIISGDGWQLMLNRGWKLKKVKGNYTIVQNSNI